ncbi:MULTISPECIES: sensor histidine kinase [Desulfovibrio]|uniref:HAMP domain-containing protein n=1 Tax=Desulfovibrio desulfuricans TaxID=876 RepID=A0AA94L2C6_DESDE|nr:MULTISPECIES: methyl-accepting chemotaxis protein [Desulfovibrio]ATD80112.1 methyl-accepting chemotaxis protein [Desulfovibrio sp. G11]SFW50902.1 HAMP domain-containing protein [Desulfovibrio desulfuricans]SPD35566.1 Prokaryotic membrane lipoprotein lipid attachment site profile [Desulfovibrio sp. G11]
MESSRATNISSAYTTAQGVAACAVTAKVSGADGRPLGVIDIDITLSALVVMVEGIKIGQTGSIILLEDSGMVLAAPQYKAWVNRNISECGVPALQDLLAAGGTGTLALDGVEKRIVVYKGFQGWRMIALMNESEVSADMNAALKQVLLAGAAITAVLLLLALWIVQSIRKPLHQMVQCTTSISNGDLDCLPSAKRFSAELLQLHTGLSRITDTCKNMRTQVTATVAAWPTAICAAASTKRNSGATLKKSSNPSMAWRAACWQLSTRYLLPS